MRMSLRGEKYSPGGNASRAKHPTSSQYGPFPDHLAAAVRQLLDAHPAVAAVGEIGLDFHYTPDTAAAMHSLLFFAIVSRRSSATRKLTLSIVFGMAEIRAFSNSIFSVSQAFCHRRHFRLSDAKHANNTFFFLCRQYANFAHGNCTEDYEEHGNARRQSGHKGEKVRFMDTRRIHDGSHSASVRRRQKAPRCLEGSA